VCLRPYLLLNPPEARLHRSWYRLGRAVCETKRHTVPLGTPHAAVVFTHSDCACNEELALANRHQKGGNQPTQEAMLQLREQLVWLHERSLEAQTCGSKKLSRSGVVGSYSGKKRREFQRALESLRLDPYGPRDARVRMFLKADKYVVGGKIDAPRCIQYRSKRYCLELARYLHGIEASTYVALDEFGTPVIAKSLNATQRAASLLAKARHFSQPYFLLLDHSKWDSHVTQAMLREEFRYYQLYFPGSSKLHRLLAEQLCNRGSTKNGTQYYTPGTRCSGDMNTGLGNSCLNAAILRSWLVASCVRGSVFVDGDDSVVIVDASDVPRLLPIPEFMNAMGHETKVETTCDFERVEFCQCRPVLIDGVWTMVRNPARLLSRSLWTTLSITSDKFRARLLKTIGECELCVAQGVPVSQSLATAMIAAGSGNLWKGYEGFARSQHEAVRPGRAHAKPISDASRHSFWRAWDVSPVEQIYLERSLWVNCSGLVSSLDLAIASDIKAHIPFEITPSCWPAGGSY
jgi:hypothetical protein